MKDHAASDGTTGSGSGSGSGSKPGWEFLERHVPFNRHMGITVDCAEPGHGRMRLPFRPEFIGDPRRPALHGGVISMLADACGGLTVHTKLEPGSALSTVDLRVDYLRPGRALALVADGRVLRLGNRVGVAEIRVFHDDAPDDWVATATAVYNVKRPRER